MENLLIEGTTARINAKPIVDFNAETGVCVLSGESFMENSYEFYDPIFQWIKDFFIEKNSIQIISKITYLNSSSKKSIYDLFKLLKDYKSKGKNIYVRWYYVQEDSSMEEDITIMCTDIGLEIDLAAIEGAEIIL